MPGLGGARSSPGENVITCREHLASYRLPSQHLRAGVLQGRLPSHCCMLGVQVPGPPSRHTMSVSEMALGSFILTSFPRIIVLTHHGELLFRKHGTQPLSPAELGRDRGGRGGTRRDREALPAETGETCSTVFWRLLLVSPGRWPTVSLTPASSRAALTPACPPATTSHKEPYTEGSQTL